MAHAKHIGKQQNSTNTGQASTAVISQPAVPVMFQKEEKKEDTKTLQLKEPLQQLIMPGTIDSAKETNNKEPFKPVQKKQIPADKTIPIQRKIKVKGGAIYNNRGELPANLQATVSLQNMADDPGNYLAASASDLTKRAAAQPSEILSPHRHLIGERHDQSKFTKAVEKWCWGADKMAESYQTSTDVKDKVTMDNKAMVETEDGPNPFYQAKELENLHPYVIQGLSMLRFVLSESKENTGNAKEAAKKIVENPNAAAAHKTNFTDIEAILKKQQALILKIWNADILPHYNSYVVACTQRLKTAKGPGNTSSALLHDMATAMVDKWPLFQKNIEVLATKCYDMFDTWKQTQILLTKRESATNNFITKAIDVWADHLVNMTKAEAQAIAGDNRHDDIISKGWTNAKAAKGLDGGKIAVESIGPMREIFMQHNINTNLNVPGIVLIGSDHVKNLKTKITDGKYHESYDAFVADTKT